MFFITISTSIMFKIEILLIVLYNFVQIYDAIDYCDKDLLCKNAGGPHIKCNNNGSFGENCPDNAQLIKLLNNDRIEIVEAHNIKRNTIAYGNITEYEPAAKMGLMIWSIELEEMAELNVKTCLFGHDQCRNTITFPISGQNIFQWKSQYPLTYPKDTFYVGIDNWFLEYENCNMDYINSYENPKHGPQIGHFTVLVSDRNNRVGCAGVEFTEDDYTTIIFACNYAYSNIKMKPVYIAGVSGSGCVTGTDSTYTALCTADEIYN